MSLITSPTTEEETTSGGGGGGGAAVSPSSIEKELKLDTQEINLDIVLEQEKERLVRITNTGNTTNTFYLEQEGLDGIIIFKKSSVTLEPGESEDVSIVFVAPNETGIYPGKIIVSGKQILVSINIMSKQLLFDALITIPDSQKKISQGDKLTSQVTLIPMSDEQPRLDVTLNYIIKDFEGKTYVQESETILVEGQKSFKKEFYTKELPPGNYVVGLELVYPNGVATSSSHFEIASKTTSNINLLMGLLVLILIVIAILTIIQIKNYKKKQRHAFTVKRMK
jgi:hypothetical protein